MGASILVADDEVGVRDLLEWELGSSGYDVTVVANGHEAVEALRGAEFDLVISDVRMPGITGLEVLKATKELAPDTEVLIATGYADLETAVACVRGGAFDFVQKPLDMNGLLATVARALERRRLRAATALYQASQTIFATKEAYRLPEAIVAVAMKVMAADDVSLMVPEAENQLRLLHSHGLEPELQAEVRAAIGERVAGRVAQSREPALLPDGLGRDARFADVPSFGRVRSSIVYPLFAGDRLLGVLNISRLQNPKPFRKEDLERASVLAAQVTLALENVRLIQQVAASERLAAVGQLAAGVGHEINNPVSCVLAGHSYLRERLEALARLDALFEQGADLQTLRTCWRELGGRDLLGEMLETLEDAEDGASRIRDIVRDLRSLARAEEQRGVIDLNEPIRSALRVAAGELRYRARVVTRLGSNVDVVGSPGRLSQVFLNLLINAAQAFDEGAASRNEIVVTSERSGDRVLASVGDNGPGIPTQNLARIFEPFFTTKGQATGTGLGLPISREIIQSHGGELRVDTVGGGATFTISLPAAATVGTEPPAPDASKPAGDLRTTRKFRILFVDDELSTLRSYERAFGQDCTIDTAENGDRALAILAERRDFNLIVCDLLMPGVSGMDVYRQIVAAHPELDGAFVFVTGGITQHHVQAFLRTIGNQVLEKPFDFAALREIISARQKT